MVASGGVDTALADEARLFGRYLVGRPIPEVLAARYVDAVQALDLDAPEPVERAILAFAHAHPWSIAALDTAAALYKRRGQGLRARLLVLAAVLEAAPDFADAFLPCQVSVPRLAWRLARHGVSIAIAAVAGCILLPLASRRRA